MIEKPKISKSLILKVQGWYFVWGEIFAPDEISTTLFDHFCMFNMTDTSLKSSR